MTSLSPAPLVILATFGTAGDLEPFLLMARGLRARGHRVCVLTSRDHEARLLESGLSHRLYGGVAKVDAVLDDPELWDERKGLGVVWRGVLEGFEEVVDLMTALASDEPCVALCHPFMLPAADVARSHRPRLRAVGAWLAPSNLRTIHDPMMLGSRRIPSWVPPAWRGALWRFVDRHWIDGVLLPGLDAVRAAHALAPVDRFFEHLGRVCDASVGLFPSWFAPRVPDWPTPFVEAGFPLAAASDSAELPAEIERFLADGPPPVVVTFGSGMRHAHATFESARRALLALGRRGVFVSRHRLQVPAVLSSGILWTPFASFDRLLPRAAAIVHHGGIGTTAQALRAGLPQLVVASGFDQFDNGERLRLLGVADALPARRASVRALRRRLGRLLRSTSVRVACEAAARRFEQPVSAGVSDAFVDRVAGALAMAASGASSCRVPMG